MTNEQKADEIELAAWRLAFSHIADGTPDGVAQAMNTELDRLNSEIQSWKQVSAGGLRIARLGSVHECQSNDNVPN